MSVTKPTQEGRSVSLVSEVDEIDNPHRGTNALSGILPSPPKGSSNTERSVCRTL